jgi:hypothetical protein
MLSNKINELLENTVFKNIKNYVTENSFFNYVFMAMFLGFFYLFDFSVLIKFSLSLLSLKFLINLDRYNQIDKIRYMTNLIKFWMFFAVSTMGFDIFGYFLIFPIFSKLIQLYMITYFYKQFSEFFSKNNYMIENQNETNTVLNDSVNIVDSTLNNIVKAYGVNKLSLDFCLNTVIYLTNKYCTTLDLSKDYIKNLFKKNVNNNMEITNQNESTQESHTDKSETATLITTEEVKSENNTSDKVDEKQKTEELTESKPVEKSNSHNKILSDNQMDLLLDSILQETLTQENNDNIDHIDDENFSIFTKKNL